MNEPEASPNMENKCPQCGGPLPSGGLAGLCPACLLQQAAAETATQPEMPPFQPPTVEELARLFPQLEIICLIGKGGMGAVYQARQPALDRIVALKILPPRVEGGADFAERFNREARALAKLNHPNIVTVHEFGQVNGLPFFVMEYVDGLNLRQLEQAGKLSPREALQIVPQICEALQFAHDAGIVHRDIKPDNILLDKKGRVKIADFGIAKIMGGAPDSAVPETQGAIGTPHYMAPEQVEKPQTVDHRADIFSLGVVFYEMLTGELPLGKFAPPSSGPRGMRVDVRLDEVVLRALEKEPDRRYQHASQVKTAVETIASTPPGAPVPPPPQNPAATPEAILARDYVLDIGHCFRRGWALLKANFWPLVGMHALIFLLMAIADSAFARISSVGNDVTASRIYDGASILGLVLAGPLWAGLFLYFLKTIRGEAVSVETAFAGFSKRFLHLFLVNLVAWFLIGLGLVCLILPGIYLLVAWCFALTLVMDKDLEFWPAMELSRKMVNKHWWMILALLLVLAGVWVLGILACCVGVLVSAPLALTVFLYAYEDIFGAKTSPAPPPGQPLPPRPMAGASPANPAQPPVSPNPASASGPSPAAGPSGTAVFPPPNATLPPGGGGSRVGKFLLVAFICVLVAVLLVTLFVAGVSFMHSAPFFLGGLHILLIGFTVIFLLVGAALVILCLKLFFSAKPSKSGGNRFLKFILATVIVVLVVLLGALVLFNSIKRHTNFRYYSKRSMSPLAPLMPVVPLQPLQPMQPLPPGAPSSPQSPQSASTEAYDNLVARVRQELGKVSVRFEKLRLSATSDKNVVISFSGLQQLETVNGAESWQDMTGSLVGLREHPPKWHFNGEGELAVVRFDIARMDLKKVLATAAILQNQAANTGGSSPPAFGPVHEVLLHSRTTASNEFLSLGTGIVLTPPPEIIEALGGNQPEDANRTWSALDIPQDSRQFSYITWLRENHVDLMYGGPGRVVGFDGLFTMAHGNSSTNWDDWESLTPEQALQNTAAAEWVRRAAEASQQGQPIPPAPAGGATASSAMQMDSRNLGGPIVNLLTRDQSVTWYFKTFQGSLGLLQILNVPGQPDAVKIRYKLIDHVPTAGAAPAAPVTTAALPIQSNEYLSDRLQAAEGISDFSVKDKSLAALAREAATDRYPEVVKAALGQMYQWDQRDAATRECALELAKDGYRKEAIDLAEGITDLALRDQVLSELAQ